MADKEDQELLRAAREDHAYAMGARAGLNAASVPCVLRLGATRCEDAPNNRKEFETAIEQMRRESLHVIRTIGR